MQEKTNLTENLIQEEEQQEEEELACMTFSNLTGTNKTLK